MGGDKEPVVLVVDPSLVSSGWAAGRGEDVQSGTVRVPQGDSDPVRVGTMVSRLMRCMTPWALKAPWSVEIVLEVARGFSYARSTRGGRAVNQAALHKQQWVVGGLMTAMASWGSIYTVDANRWKGNRAKWVDRAMAPEAKSHDEADALALYHWWRRVGRQLMTKETR